MQWKLACYEHQFRTLLQKIYHIHGCIQGIFEILFLFSPGSNLSECAVAQLLDTMSACVRGFWPEGARYPIFRIWGQFDGQDWLEWYQYSEEELLIVCCLLPVHSHLPCGRQSTPVCVFVHMWKLECGLCFRLWLGDTVSHKESVQNKGEKEKYFTVLDCRCRFPQTCSKSFRFSVFQMNLQLLWLLQPKSLFTSQSGWIVHREFLLQAVSHSHSFKCSIFSLGCDFMWDGEILRYLCLWAQLYGSPAAVYLTCTEKDGTQRVTWGDNPKQGCRQAANQ